MATSERVVIGMDPHKRSVTIEVMAADEEVLGGGRFGTDADSFKAMTAYVVQWPAVSFKATAHHRVIRKLT